MRSEEEVAAAAGSMTDRGVSQRTMKSHEDTTAELEATREELERAYDTIEGLTKSLAFLRQRRRA